VIVNFNAGSEIFLKGLGTGHIEFLGKLVSDPSTQLVVASA